MNDRQTMGEHCPSTDQQGVGDRIRKNAVFDALAVPAWLADEDGSLIAANPAWCELIGCDASEHLGSGWAKVLPVREQDKVPERYRNAFEANRNFKIVHSVVSWNGREWRVSASARKLEVGAGNEPGWIITFDTGAELRDIIDALPAWMWLKDQDDRNLQINAPAAATMGRAVEDLEGMHTVELYPDEAERYFRDDCEVRETRTPKLNIVEPFQPEAGPEIFISTDKIPLLDEDGKARRVLVLAHNVTAQIEKERSLCHRAGELERSNTALDEFAHATSHDLKRPLRAIEHLASWISEDAGSELSKESTNDLQALMDNAVKLRQLIDGLLEYARAGSDDDVDVVLDDLLADLPTLAALPDSFALELPETGLQVSARPAQLLQVLTNLVSNALSHHDQESGTVKVRCEVQGERLFFEVEDDGPGILKKDRERVFRLFETLDSESQGERTGMGLALVRKTVASLGGTVELRSGLQRGSIFGFDWPAAASSSEADELA